MIKNCSANNNYQIGETSNNRSQKGTPFCSPPYVFGFKDYMISSVSNYLDHSVLTTTDGDAFGFGDNRASIISCSFQKKVLKTPTKIEIKDLNDQKYRILSANCGYDFTLYHISFSEDQSIKLALASMNIQSQYPII